MAEKGPFHPLVKTTVRVVKNLKQTEQIQKVSMKRLFRARICKRLRSPGIDSKELFPSACESIPVPFKRFTNTGSAAISEYTSVQG
jgi:hypothetical protein